MYFETETNLRRILFMDQILFVQALMNSLQLLMINRFLYSLNSALSKCIRTKNQRF